MAQLLGVPGVTWLELLQISMQCSAPPLQLATCSLGGMDALPVRAHRWRRQQLQPPPAPEVPRTGPGAAGDVGLGSEEDGARGQLQGGSAGAGPPSRLLPPAMWPEYLALVGKPEAGVAGVGVSAAAARGLLLRHGGLSGVVEAAQQGVLDDRLRLTAQQRPLPPAGVAAVAAAASPSREAAVGAEAGAAAGPRGGLGQGSGKLPQPQPGDVPAMLQAALTNLLVTRFRADPWVLPTHVIAALGRPPVPLPRLPAAPGRHRRSAGLCDAAGTADGGRVAVAPEVALLHPWLRWHVESCQPYCEALALALELQLEQPQQPRTPVQPAAPVAGPPHACAVVAVTGVVLLPNGHYLDLWAVLAGGAPSAGAGPTAGLRAAAGGSRANSGGAAGGGGSQDAAAAGHVAAAAVRAMAAALRSQLAAASSERGGPASRPASLGVALLGPADFQGPATPSATGTGSRQRTAPLSGLQGNPRSSTQRGRDGDDGGGVGASGKDGSGGIALAGWALWAAERVGRRSDLHHVPDKLKVGGGGRRGVGGAWAGRRSGCEAGLQQ